MLQKSKVKVLEEVARHLRLRWSAERQSDRGTLVVPSPNGDSKAGCGKAILDFDLKSVKV